MRAFILCITLLTLIAGCKQSAVTSSFIGTDSLVIHFKDERAGLVTKTVQTTEAKAINRMINFIDTKKTDSLNCGYDGKIFFYNKGQQIQEVDFKMRDDNCNHFVFSIDKKQLIYTKMNNEAVDFLDALEKGLPSYY